MNMFESTEADILNNYNYYEEDEWKVWERVMSTSLPTNTIPPDNTKYYKIAHLFIRDLHACQQTDIYFTVNNKSFLYLYLSGTIISQHDHNEKLCLIVNDGTANIPCLLENNIFEEIKREKQYLKESTTNYSQNSIFCRALWLNFRATQELFKHIPSREDLHPGGVVAVTGKLTEYNGKKYVFVIKIMNISIDEHIEKLETLLHK